MARDIPKGARINPAPGMELAKKIMSDVALEERIVKLEKENKELRERLDRLERSTTFREWLEQAF